MATEVSVRRVKGATTEFGKDHRIMNGKPRIIALVAALAALVPAAACAKGGGQNAATSQAGGQNAATLGAGGGSGGGGMTLAQFEARRGGRLMAADSDGDGRVSRAEFIAAHKGRGDPAKWFDRIDANRDGVLDKGEVDAMLARRFHRMDANGDGIVSRDERAAMHRGADQAGGQAGAADAGDGNE